ncbi:hypothetical protein C9974_00500 [Marinobacter sp. B9-2]|nr:hypothetical protein C9974_00500 [Marinobacter sp. B9-2]
MKKISPPFFRFANMGLRGITLLSKFLLIFFLAAYLSPTELGVYGLFAATIAYTVFILGLDFYAYTTRQILKRNENEWGKLLKSQGALHGILYLFFLPLLLLLFSYGFLDWHMAPWFFVLLILEHINQELMRLLIAISHQFAATMALFFRQGLWAAVITVWMFAYEETRQLNYVFAAWLLGNVCALAVGIVVIVRENIGGWSSRTDWSWLKKGLPIALPILVSTVCLRGVFTLDRYYIDWFAGSEVLGAYVLFISLASALMAFLDAGVFSYFYPSLIHAHNQNDRKSFERVLQSMTRNTLVVSLGFCVSATIALGPLLDFIDKEIYLSYRNIFYILLAAIAVQGIGNIFHYGLYAQGKDKSNIAGNALSLLLFVGAVGLIDAQNSIYVVPVSILLSMSFLMLWKLGFYKASSRQFS